MGKEYVIYSLCCYGEMVDMCKGNKNNFIEIVYCMEAIEVAEQL